MIPATKLFRSDSPHVVLSKTKVLELADGSLKVDRENPGFGLEIAFDYAVYATGSLWHYAFQPERDDTLQEIKDNFKQSQAQVAAATSVLIVGGGPTGIEIAGEITERHPGKKVSGS